MSRWRVPYPKFGAGPALARTEVVAARLGLDLARFGADGAVIVGSNGKGSTAAMCAALMGEGAGLFTSPHLFALNERFRIGDEDIGDEALAHHWARVQGAARAAGEEENLGGFEFLFLIAADWFTARGCTHTIWEAGLGGRLDPVRLIAAPRLALTSLDLEHTALLGDTLEAIAREKIEAAPPGATLYVGASCAPQRAAIEAHASARGVRVAWPAPLADAPLAGAHQGANAALAAALAQDMGVSATPEGFARIRWAGRLEVLQEAPLVVIDVGHTPAAAAAARAGFAELAGARACVLVCGASADKAAGPLIAALAPGFSTIICAAAVHKGAPPAEIAAHASAQNPGAELIVAESVAEARALALAKAGLDGAVLAAGGLFLAAEFRAAHLGRDPAGLAFF